MFADAEGTMFSVADKWSSENRVLIGTSEVIVREAYNLGAG